MPTPTMPYTLFVDDSGSKDYIDKYDLNNISSPSNYEDDVAFWRNNYFVLCGVQVKNSDLGTINSEFNDLKKHFFGTPNVEIKSERLRQPFSQRKHYLEPFGLTPEALKDFSLKYHDLITGHKAELKLFAIVFDKRYIRNRDEPNHNPLLKSCHLLFERVEMTGAKTKIIFDQMESSLHKTKGSQGKILNVRNKNDGMRNIFFSDYKNITDLEFQDSRHSNFLQIADICAYNVHRQFQMYGRHWIKNPEKGKGLPSYEFFDRIAHNFYCNSRGRVSGIGIKLFPVPTDKWRIPIGTKKPR